MGTTPFQMMMGRPPATVMSVLDVVKRVREQHERVGELSARGHLAVFEVGDYVLVARVRKQVCVPRLVQT